MLTCCHFLERLLDLHACLRSHHIIQPSLFRRLGALCHDFHLVATMQHLFDGHILTIHLGTYATASKFCMNQKSKVEHCGSLWQFIKIAFRREDKHLILIEIHLKLIHYLHIATVSSLEGFTYGG